MTPPPSPDDPRAIERLLGLFREAGAREALVADDGIRTFEALVEDVAGAGAALADAGVAPGAVVTLEADFSLRSIPMLLALIERGCVAVPIAPPSAVHADALVEIAEAEWRIREREGALDVARTGTAAGHGLYGRLREPGHPGLVLFTSGSSGRPKGAVHDLTRLLAKYLTPRRSLRTVMFLLFDHIGGFDTLFYTLSNASAAILVRGRSPETVCATIARTRAEVLPASPSFLAMMLLSGAHERHDLSSLRYVTYGAEVMPQSTLDALARRFPDVKILQKYGLTELGTLRSQSRANDSLWVRVGGEGYETRVVDGLLQIRAHSSMLGYLNAPSPFTDDGWFMTGDAVEVDGDFFRILGRASDLINVGGAKVYPAEVEGVIEELENVAEAAVSGEPHPFMGQIVVARVRLKAPAEPREVERLVRVHCRERLEAYKVPMRVEVVEGPLHTDRHKKSRR